MFVLFTELHVADHYFISSKIIHLEDDLDSKNSGMPMPN
jgi:hypothetical protein